jgi:DNA-binding IclR family transcriptional regulator
MTDASPREIKSIITYHKIIEELQRLDGAGASQIAETLDIGRSTVYQYLSTLHSEGYVRKKNKQYYIGLKYLDHGMYARNRHPIIELARPSLNSLIEETGEIGWLTSEDNGKLVTLDVAVGKRDLNNKFRGRIGNREFLHAHAGGKAILATYSDEEVSRIINEYGLPEYTPQTITDTERLFEELETIRDTDIATNDEEAITGYRAVSAAVTQDDETIGSITVGGPKHRLRGEYFSKELPDLLRGVINEIDLRGSISSPWK